MKHQIALVELELTVSKPSSESASNGCRLCCTSWRTLSLQRGLLPHPQHQYVAAVLRNITKLVTMVQDLQDFPERNAFEFEVVSLKTC